MSVEAEERRHRLAVIYMDRWNDEADMEQRAGRAMMLPISSLDYRSLQAPGPNIHQLCALRL